MRNDVDPVECAVMVKRMGMGAAKEVQDDAAWEFGAGEEEGQ